MRSFDGMSDGATKRCGGWKYAGHEGREPHECPVAEFGTHKRYGLRRQCRACRAAYDANPAAKAKVKAYHAARNATPEGKASNKARKAKYWATDFLKVKDSFMREACTKRKRPYDARYLNDVTSYIASCGPFPRCAYCLRDLCLERGRGIGHADSLSFDEVFPCRGVVPGNVAVVCSYCNNAKHHHDSRIAARTMHPDWVARVIEYEVRARKILGLPEDWWPDAEAAAEQAA